jgi:hypothetical protein
MKYRHPDKLIIQIIPEYFDSLLDSMAGDESEQGFCSPV